VLPTLDERILMSGRTHLMNGMIRVVDEAGWAAVHWRNTAIHWFRVDHGRRGGEDERTDATTLFT
jgi:hypothetical protein